MNVVVRPRADADLDGCEAVAVAVHRLDGFPPYLPAGLRSFLTTPVAVGAWVAEIDGRIVGHVALHRRSSTPVMALAAQATGRPLDGLAVVARLLVAPDARRRGIGRSLLGTAAAAASERGLWPVLDVACGFDPAVALYEDCGWTRAGRVSVRLGGEFAIDELVYIAPVPTPVRSTPA